MFLPALAFTHTLRLPRKWSAPVEAVVALKRGSNLDFRCLRRRVRAFFSAVGWNETRPWLVDPLVVYNQQAFGAKLTYSLKILRKTNGGSG